MSLPPVIPEVSPSAAAEDDWTESMGISIPSGIECIGPTSGLGVGIVGDIGPSTRDAVTCPLVGAGVITVDADSVIRPAFMPGSCI